KKEVEKVSIAPSLAFYQVPKNPGRSGILLPPFSSKDRILFLHFSLLFSLLFYYYRVGVRIARLRTIGGYISGHTLSDTYMRRNFSIIFVPTAFVKISSPCPASQILK